MSDAEILQEFLVESREGLDKLDREFVELEREPGNRARIANIFRTIHTIKGTCGFLGFQKLEAMTHAGETLLSRLRDGDLTLTSDIITVLLSLVDIVRATLSVIETSGVDGDEAHPELIGQLNTLADGKPIAPPAPPAAALASKRVEDVTPLGEILVRDGVLQKEELKAALEQQKLDSRQVGEILIERQAVSPAQVLGALEKQTEERVQKQSDGSVRVDVTLLDQLMDLVGELVLARNQILQFGATVKDPAFHGPTQRLNVLTTELQEGMMKTRMQPIGSVWNKLPRVIRDVSMACGKQVALRASGGETDLDRTVVEAIKDPLTHIVRNSIDHGIESPDMRVARGKSPTGVLGLRAYHEGGQVNIEISDDGAGIDPKKVREAAVRKGLISPERASRMSDRESVDLIFLPGFSTASAVTNVSGRGVGMDVVRTNIEKIGGNVDVQSTVGFGTTLKIKIPLTLAIIPALIVACRGGRYAIPQVNLLELVRIEGAAVAAAIERVQGAPVFRLRGNLLPLVDLAETLGLPWTPPKSDTDPTLSIIVLQADDRRFGLVVDGVSDTQEIVVKPLGPELKGIPVFAGATIMGDGKVALILDVLGVAHQGDVGATSGSRLADERNARASTVDMVESVLVAQSRAGRRIAVPLSLVARLEEIPRNAIERAGDLCVSQYRGDILPLVDVGTLFGEPKGALEQGDKPLQVIVSGDSEQMIGIVVDRIIDIVEEPLTIKPTRACQGVRGAAILQSKVTEVLDVAEIVRLFGHQVAQTESTAA